MEPVVIIQTFKKESDPLSLPKLLQIHEPRYIVMYDADMMAIRQIEVRDNIELIVFDRFRFYSLVSLCRSSKITIRLFALPFISQSTLAPSRNKLI